MRPSTIKALALCVAALLTACSSGGSGSSTAATTSPTTSPTTSEVATSDPSDAGGPTDAGDTADTSDAGQHDAGPPPPPSYLDPNIMAVDFSADGHRALLSADREIIVFDMQSRSQRRLGPLAGSASAVRFAPTGHVFAIGERSGNVELWDARSGNYLRSVKASSAAIVSVRFSPDGRLAVALPEDGPLRVFRPDNGATVAEITSEYLVDAAFYGGGRHLVGVNSAFGFGFDLSDKAPKKEPESLLLDTGGTFPSAVSPDGVWLASAATDGHGLRVWSTYPFASKKQLLTVNSCNEHIVSIEFSPNGKTLLARQQNGVQYAFHTKGDWSLRSRWAPPAGIVENATATVASREGELYAVATTSEAGDSKLRVFSMTSDGPPRVMQNSDRLRELRFSPDNRYLLGVLDDYKGGKVWSTSTGNVVVQYLLKAAP